MYAPCRVTAPYWKAAWLRDGPACCTLHPELRGWIPLSALRRRPNMRSLLTYISGRWHYSIGRFARP